MSRFAPLLCTLMICSSSVHAQSTSEENGRKLMTAASVVMAIISVASGELDVLSADKAVITGRNGANIVRAGDCIYTEESTNPNVGHRTLKLDFSQLTGEYHDIGQGMIFVGRGSTQCFYFSEHEKGCYNGLRATFVADRQRLIDNVTYLFNHGCRAKSPEPY